MRALLIAAVLALGCQSASTPPPPAPGGGSGGTTPPTTGGSGGSGGSGGGAGIGVLADAAALDAPLAPDVRPAADAPPAADASPAADGGAGDLVVPESAFLPGRPDIRLCKKEWSQEQCCAFLCSCLGNICGDSAKAKPGLPTCMSWCPKIGSAAVRCHVYHCYISVSPTGGIKDHDSHCGHAANEVGGDCPAAVTQ